jgi:hypothetical protein
VLGRTLLLVSWPAALGFAACACLVLDRLVLAFFLFVCGLQRPWFQREYNTRFTCFSVHESL